MFIAAPSVWDGFPVSDTVPFISDISDKHYETISLKIAAERENTASLSVTRSAGADTTVSGQVTWKHPKMWRISKRGFLQLENMCP